MKPLKGIVISINDEDVTLLGNDGLFYSVPHPQHVPMLGEELSIPAQSTSPHATKKEQWFSAKHVKRWGLIASICLLILTSVIFSPRTADASYIVALDINPSVEIYLDKQYKVLKVVAITDDATALLQPLKLKGKDLSNAIYEITSQAKVEGYLSQSVESMLDSKQVVATIVPLDTSVDDDILVTQIQQQLSTVNEEEILIRTTSIETLEMAHKEQLPVYKYEVVKTIESQGIDIDTTLIQTHSAVELVEKYNIDPKQVKDKTKENAPSSNKQRQNEKKEEKKVEKDNKQREKEQRKQEKNKQKEDKKQDKKIEKVPDKPNNDTKEKDNKGTKQKEDKKKDNSKTIKDQQKEKSKNNNDRNNKPDKNNKNNNNNSKEKNNDSKKDSKSNKDSTSNNKNKDKNSNASNNKNTNKNNKGNKNNE